jgi:RNA polymerase sigma-70 factor (ECF subfamily)
MEGDQSTCWTVIRGAAAGSAAERSEFARRYEGIVTAYFAARWRGTALVSDVDDAVQEVFVDCFKADGALDRADSARGFRPFLHGVARNIALRFETRRARRKERPAGSAMPELTSPDEEQLSRLFDRTWAQAVMRQAAQVQADAARLAGPEAVRRVELLELRFQDGLPIREIAARWSADADHLHREYAKARKEFRRALAEAVAFHLPGSPDEVERECARLLEVLR